MTRENIYDLSLQKKHYHLLRNIHSRYQTLRNIKYNKNSMENITFECAKSLYNI
jgi:hypothetical protein